MTKTENSIISLFDIFVLNFELLNFGFVSDFGFRASNLFVPSFSSTHGYVAPILLYSGFPAIGTIDRY